MAEHQHRGLEHDGHAGHQHGAHADHNHGDHAHHPSDDGHQQPHAHHRFDDPERWAKVFDDPERDAWQKPDEVVALLDIRHGMRVADIGAGTGYFMSRLSRAAGEDGDDDGTDDLHAGEDGDVVMIDIEPTMVDYMKARAIREGAANVTCVVTAPDVPGLREPTQRVLIVDTWHHIENRAAWLAAMRPHLTSGARVVVIDFTPDSPMGPPPAMRIPAEAVVKELTDAGFTAGIAAETLPNQFAVVATFR